MPSDGTELIVRKGRVILSDSPHTKVKGGNKVVFSATSTAIAKLTKEEKKKGVEDIEVWSKDRAETLAKANRRITDRMLDSAFASMNNSMFSPRSLGFWFFNSRAGCYTFLPLFYGIGSPYGGSYNTSIYNPGFSPRGYNLPASVTQGTMSGQTGYPSSNPASSPMSNPGMGSTPSSRGASSIEGGSRISSKIETMNRQP